MTDSSKDPAGARLLVVVSWLAVGIPLAWGVAMTLRKALLLFSGPTP